MTCGNTSDFINHPLPKNYVGPPTTPGPQDQLTSREPNCHFFHFVNGLTVSILLKALVLLHAFEESVDCHLLSSFCDVCTFHDGCKQGIDQQIFNRKSISRKITHPQS